MAVRSSDSINHGYSILRLVVDEVKGERIPVGVVSWDSSRQWYGLRLLSRDERIAGIDRTGRTFLRIAESEIKAWVEKEDVPYLREREVPWKEGFWLAIRRIMTTAIQLDPPRAMNPMSSPETEFESLFEAIVQPSHPPQKRVERIDGALTRALGSLAEIIPARQEFVAFGGLKETVLRGAKGPDRDLLLEGVNLAGADARRDADVLVSKLLRILAATPTSREVRVIVGYYASPDGLNGEAAMRDWIRERVTNDVFDVVRESNELVRKTAEVYSEIGVENPRLSL